MGKKIQDTKDSWKAEKQGTDSVIKCSLEPFVSDLFQVSLSLLTYSSFILAFKI